MSNFEITISLLVLLATCNVYHVNSSLQEECQSQCVCIVNKMTCENVVLKEKDLAGLKIPGDVTELVLRSNQLESISETALLGLKQLQVLEISENLITKIPIFTFRGFSKLLSLTLNQNQIKEISEGSFIGLQNLVKIELKQNHISSLQPGVFDKLESIKSIDMNFNSIVSLKNDVFTQLAHLRNLFLEENKISEIGDRVFAGMQMEFLSLSSNNIQSITETTFDGFQIPRQINLLKNPFDCSCAHAMRYAKKFGHLTKKLWGFCRPSQYFREHDTLIREAHKKLDHCSLCHLNPCQNQGACTGDKKSFQCQCQERYKGKTCEVNICHSINQNNNNNMVNGGIQPDMIPLKQINHTQILIVKERVNNEDDAKKLKILYAMCSFEFIVIICFVVYFMWKRYDEWKLQKKYEHEKSRAILYSIRNQTNAQLAKALVEENEEFPTDLKNMILKGSVPV